MRGDASLRRFITRGIYSRAAVERGSTLAANQKVVAGIAFELVIAIAAVELVVALAASQLVVAR